MGRGRGGMVIAVVGVGGMKGRRCGRIDGIVQSVQYMQTKKIAICNEIYSPSEYVHTVHMYDVLLQVCEKPIM